MKRREKRHSPLPWRSFKACMNAIEVRSKGGYVVCEIINNEAATLTPLMEDNAEFIALAANCHAELLEVIKEMLGILDDFVIPKVGSESVAHQIAGDARAAIAKATGGA